MTRKPPKCSRCARPGADRPHRPVCPAALGQALEFSASDGQRRSTSDARWLRKARAAVHDIDAAPPCDTCNGDTLGIALARDVWRTLDPEGYRKAVKRG